MPACRDWSWGTTHIADLRSSAIRDMPFWRIQTDASRSWRRVPLYPYYISYWCLCISRFNQRFLKAFINLFNSAYSRLDFFCQTILKLYPANLTSKPYSRSSNSSSIISLSPGRVPLPFQWPYACVLYLPEWLQAESQNDAGSHGRIAEHVAAPIGQRLTDGRFLH